MGPIGPGGPGRSRQNAEGIPPDGPPDRARVLDRRLMNCALAGLRTAGRIGGGAELQGGLDRIAKRSQVVFADEGASAGVYDFGDLRRIIAPGYTEGRDVQTAAADHRERFPAAESGQFVIRDDNVPRVLFQRAPQFGSVVNPSDQRGKATTPELPDEQLAVILAVFIDEDPQRLVSRGRFRGRDGGDRKSTR